MLKDKSEYLETKKKKSKKKKLNTRAAKLNRAIEKEYIDEGIMKNYTEEQKQEENAKN